MNNAMKRTRIICAEPTHQPLFNALNIGKRKLRIKYM